MWCSYPARAGSLRVMTAFTKISRADVDNSAEAFGMGEFQDSRFFNDALDAEQLGVAWHRIKPGKRSPISHRHRAQEEIYVVIGGSGRAKLEDETVELTAGDLLRVAPSTARGFEAGDDGLEYVAVGATIADGDERDRGEMIEDFWS